MEVSILEKTLLFHLEYQNVTLYKELERHHAKMKN